MHRTLTLFTTTLLTGTLAGSLALAAPRPKAPPVPARLTDDERLCASYGAFAAEIAKARDDGLPLTTVLATVRTLVVRQPTEAPFIDNYLRIVRGIFAAYTFSPASWRQQVEGTCLEKLDPRPASTLPPSDRR